MEYESRMTHVLARHNCFALCQYNRRLFPPELVLDVIRTHPTVIYRGVVCRNMYYVPPDELLGTDQAAQEVERLLTNIREREEIEFTLRQQRNELQDSEERFRQIAENIREVFWVRDVADDRITFVSPVYEEVFGRSRASLYANSRAFLDAVHADDRARIEAAVARQRDGTPTDERYRVIRPDGSMRWIRSRAFLVRKPEGSIARVVGVAEDITEAQHQLEDIRLAETALRSSEERWRSVFENSAIGIVLADPSGTFVEANRAFQDLVGYTNEELKTLNYVDITHDADIGRGAELIGQLVSGAKREVQIEKRYRHKDGRFIWVRATGTVIPGSDRSPRYLLGLVEDVTDRKMAEQELDVSVSQLRALAGRLMHAQDDERRRIARMLHETTAQDLAALKMHLARLNRTASHLSEPDRSALTDSISLAEQSITEIRTLSYLLHPPFLDEMGLLSALRWYAAGFAERSGITVDLELPESFDRLPLDTETALFRIVQESLINIHRHAGSETARIRLRRDAGGARAGDRRSRPRHPEGFARAHHERRRPRRCGDRRHERADRAGGRAPRDRVERSRDDRPRPVAARAGGRLMPLRILVVDDHAVVRRGVRSLLESHEGWEVCGEATTGRDAVEQSRRLRPDVVVMDLSLPELNGLDATRQILKDAPDTEVLVLTMHQSEELARDVLQAGARGYVLKSDADENLIAAVDSLRQHKPFLTSAVTEFVLDDYVRRGDATPDDPAPVAVTAREREIIQLVAEGQSNKRGGGDARHQREDDRGPPREHHEKAASPLGQRPRALRDPQ